MKLNKKKGFTLIEIIVVIIIVGVLAALALPRFFSTIEFSRSAEALTNLGVIRNSIERCDLIATTFSTQCDAFDELDVDDPGVAAGALFTYAISGLGGAAQGARNYTVTATRAAGAPAGTVVLTVTAGEVVKSGTGSFGGIH